MTLFDELLGSDARKTNRVISEVLEFLAKELGYEIKITDKGAEMLETEVPQPVTSANIIQFLLNKAGFTRLDVYEALAQDRRQMQIAKLERELKNLKGE